jgi:hypothetical protein
MGRSGMSIPACSKSFSLTNALLIIVYNLI